MLLDFDRIVPLLRGSLRVEAGPEGLRLHRFSSELEALAGSYFHRKCICASGIRLGFVTDASSVNLKMNLADPQGLDYLGDADVVIDRGEIRTFAAPAPRSDPAGQSFELAFALPPGQHEVVIHLSAQRGVAIREFELGDATVVLPAALPRETLLFLGDSITQGFFASPARVWCSLLAAQLGCDYFNLGIGGARMPGFDYGQALSAYPGKRIFVAYGVNDCNGNRILENFREETVRLLEALTLRPEAHIYLLTPIPWPNGTVQGKKLRLNQFRRILTEVGAGFSNVSVIDGRRLLSEDAGNFYDGCHPNNFGMQQIAANLPSLLN